MQTSGQVEPLASSRSTGRQSGASSQGTSPQPSKLLPAGLDFPPGTPVSCTAPRSLDPASRGGTTRIACSTQHLPNQAAKMPPRLAFSSSGLPAPGAPLGLACYFFWSGT